MPPMEQHWRADHPAATWSTKIRGSHVSSPFAKTKRRLFSEHLNSFPFPLKGPLAHSFYPRFEKLQGDHQKHHQAILKNMLESGPTVAVEAAREEPVEGKDDQKEQPDFQTFESIEKMEASEEILSRCVSEISGVEILKGKKGGIYLVSEKKRILPRHTLVGGYGAGKCLGFSLFHIVSDCFRSF